MTEPHENSEKGKKRKKKRSSIQMAKKFARRRNHGTDVDNDTYQYMIRILELIRGDFPTAEEKLMFVNNVYEQTIGNELDYARNQVGSRVLDSLLPYANLPAIQRLYDAFASSLRPLSSDRFASHVLQKMILVCADRGNGSLSPKANSSDTADAVIDVKESDIKAYNDIALKLSRYVINNIEEFVFDTYANHLLRTAVECLGGLIDKTQNDGKKKVVYSERRTVVPEYKELLIQTCNRLQKWPQFLEFGRDELTSGLLQSILHTLKDVDSETMDSYIKKIRAECFQPSEDKALSNIFECESSVRLLEACLAVANPKSFKKIFKKYFHGKLKELSLTQSTNFSVQRLLDHCATKEEFEEIYDEISLCFPDILGKNYTGVLSSTGNACLRLQTKQGAFLNEMTKMLHCDTNVQQSMIVACITTLKTPEQLQTLKNDKETNVFINLHGSLIIQAALNFNKPIKVVNSLLEMETEELLHLISDPKGSRIVDAFMDSKFIGEKSREKLGKKLRGCWAQLAQSTHGSRSLDRLWQWAQNNQRVQIMEELAAIGESLRSTKSGQIMFTKLNVALFARNKKDWTESQGKEEKTRGLFADIIG